MKNAAANAAAFFCIYESRAPRPMPRRFLYLRKPGAAANAAAFFCIYESRAPRPMPRRLFGLPTSW